MDDVNSGATNERRNFTRIPFKSFASITSKKTSATGDVENLSLNGMFLLTSADVDQGDDVEVKIYLSGTSSELFINLKGTVKRRDERGLGIEFKMEKMDIDSLTFLRHAIAYNTGDDQRVMREYSEFLDRRAKDNSKRPE